MTVIKQHISQLKESHKQHISHLKQSHKTRSIRIKKSIQSFFPNQAVKEIDIMSSHADHIAEHNAKYVEAFDKGGLALPPAKGYAIVTCIDARIDAPRAFGRELGDAHIMQNAGGSTRDALRSLIISQQLLGTKEVLVIKHTDCGMLTFKNEDARAVVKKNLGADASNIDFLPFADLEQAVKDDVKFLQDSEFIGEGVKVTGWIYDVKTGKVSPVV